MFILRLQIFILTFSLVLGDTFNSTPCSFNANCMCSDITEIYCWTPGSSFPNFPNNYTEIVYSITVEGSFDNIPDYAFGSLRPPYVYLRRKASNTAIPLNVSDKSFVSLDYYKKPSVTYYQTISFDGFLGMSQIPTEALSITNVQYVESLVFNGCNFVNLRNGSFAKVSVATKLIINDSNIATVEQIAFAGMIIQQKRPPNLYIVGNKFLTRVPSAINQGVFTSVSLSDNGITYVGDDVFSMGITSIGTQLNFYSLNTIDLSKNRIENVTEWAFANLANLTTLNFNDNVLTDVPTNALNHVKSVQNFNIAGNRLTSLPTEVFKNLDVFQYTFERNPITDIPLGAFDGLHEIQFDINLLPNLTSFDVSTVYGVQWVTEVKIENCPNLSMLDMSDPSKVPVQMATVISPPSIQYVSENFQQWLRGFPNRTLFVSSKNYACDPKMLWMAPFVLCVQYPKTVGTIDVSTASCSSGQSMTSYLHENTNQVPCGASSLVLHFVIIFLCSVLYFFQSISLF